MTGIEKKKMILEEMQEKPKKAKAKNVVQQKKFRPVWRDLIEDEENKEDENN